MTLLDAERGTSFENISRRLSNEPGPVVTTIISFEEQTRGWLSFIATSKRLEREVEGYRRLHHLLEKYSIRPVLDFDDASASRYEELKRSRVRIGTMDLKIAAICIAHDARLLTRNVRDFGAIPALRVENWVD